MDVKLRDTTRGGGEGISTDQLKAIMALLEHTTVEKVARACGTHKNTIYKWLREDVQFQDAWRDARKEAFSATVARLQTASSGAVDTLVEVAEDPNQQGAARVSASRAILDYAVKSVEVESVIARIEALERQTEDE
jgi:AcrR family transcriptional regulator